MYVIHYIHTTITVTHSDSSFPLPSVIIFHVLLLLVVLRIVLVMKEEKGLCLRGGGWRMG